MIFMRECGMDLTINLSASGKVSCHCDVNQEISNKVIV
jgi:hypothetical protein